MFISRSVSLRPVTYEATTEGTLDTVNLSSIEHSCLGKVTWLNYKRRCFRPVVECRQTCAFHLQALEIGPRPINNYICRNSWCSSKNCSVAVNIGEVLSAGAAENLFAHIKERWIGLRYDWSCFFRHTITTCVTYISFTSNSWWRQTCGSRSVWKTLPDTADDGRDLTARVELLPTRLVFRPDVICRSPSFYLSLAVTADDRVVLACVYETQAGENQGTYIVDGAAISRPVGKRRQTVRFALIVVAVWHSLSTDRHCRCYTQDSYRALLRISVQLAPKPLNSLSTQWLVQPAVWFVYSFCPVRYRIAVKIAQ